jgi:hypothetical protein
LGEKIAGGFDKASSSGVPNDWASIESATVTGRFWAGTAPPTLQRRTICGTHKAILLKGDPPDRLRSPLIMSVFETIVPVPFGSIIE